MKTIIHVLIAVLVCLTTEAQSQTSDTDNVKFLPLVGDETPISAILARPRQYLGKEIILAGAVQVANYYNYGYENANGTHFSLKFRAGLHGVEWVNLRGGGQFEVLFDGRK